MITPDRLAWLEDVERRYEDAMQKFFALRKENVSLRSEIKELKKKLAALRKEKKSAT
jgi:hypothetical protein